MSSAKGEGPIVLIGAGKMGGALLQGWLAQGVAGSDLAVRDPSPPEDVLRLVVEHGIALNPDIDALAARRPRVVVLAVKPQLFADVLPALRPLVQPGTVFLSIAAGVSLARLGALLGEGAAIVRAMPNTPASVGRGVSAAIGNAQVDEAAKAETGALLEAAGQALWLPSEDLMDAVTALSGSGPAYVFHMVEAMAAAGVSLGLAPDMAMALARATVSGAGEMLHVQDEDAAQLRQNVTSPGGTTEAALKVLMDTDGLTGLVTRAMMAARDRSRELGK